MKKSIKLTKIVWIVNFSMLAFVVFFGIQQGGKGADMAKMESEIRQIQANKQNYIETMLVSSNTEQIAQKALELEFTKPVATVYIDSQDVLTSNLVR